jgi:signal transduction histidine kinase
MLCFHLERKKSGKRVLLVEGLTTSLAAVIAGVAALALSLNILDWEELVKRMHFSIPAAALLGLITGSIFPHRYRLQAIETLKLQRDAVDLKDVIEKSIRKFKDRAENDNIQIAMNVADDIPKLKLDPDRIDQAITSLISNAIEFTPEGGRIGVSAEVAEEQGIRLRVNDSGIGMTEKQVDAVIHAPKDKLDHAWIDGESRNDVDLYQIRFITEKHGGRFNLKSSLFEGTDVTIDLPDHLKVDVTPPVDLEEPEEYEPKPLAA